MNLISIKESNMECMHLITKSTINREEDGELWTTVVCAECGKVLRHERYDDTDDLPGHRG